MCRGSNSTGERFANWLGRRLALRNKNVAIAPDAAISPGALINPRSGKISIGARSIIATGAHVQGNVAIGDDSSVQSYSIVVGYSGGEIKIGNNVRIAAHCMIIGGNHRFDRTDVPIRSQGHQMLPVVIEDDVWIGGSVNILAGVTIGSGSVIGAGSVVTKDIPPGSVAVGTPAKVIKKRI